MKPNFYAKLFLLFTFLFVAKANAQCPTASLGNRTFNTQADIDNFKANYNHCTNISVANLTIGYDAGSTNSDINDISALSKITTVTGNIIIRRNPNLTSLNGLQGITSLSGYFRIEKCDALTNITALTGITQARYINIRDNAELTNLNGLHNLTQITGSGSGSGYLYLLNNAKLANVDALQNLTTIGNYIQIEQNSLLQNLNGLSNVTSINGNIVIRNNAVLDNITGLKNIAASSISGSGSGLLIQDNPNLAVCNLPNFCTYLSGSGNRTISGNKTTCIDEQAVLEACIPFGPDNNNILYVNSSVSGGNNKGNSWANAVPELADALKYARTQNNYTSANPLKIYVAKGTYKPMYSPEDGANLLTDQGRDNAFLMVNNVQIYGGFDPVNNIDDLSDTRIFGSGGSVLSGDIGTSNDNTDNTYHVVVSSGAVGVALLDGFTVTGGYSTSSNTGDIFVNSLPLSRYYGGGMYNHTSSPSISNCHFTGNTANFGGGMYNSSSSPTISNCSFTGNAATFGGGGMYNFYSSPTISNSRFTENTATYYGGGMYNHTSSLSITASGFIGNTASSGGGGMYNNASSPIISNCSFTGNAATFGGGMCNIATSSSPTLANTTVANNGSSGFYTERGTPVLQNSIIWETITGNYTAKYSLLKDLNPTGTGNIDATSLAATDIFTDYANGDYTLKNGGVAVNAGSNALFTGLDANTKDLAGNPRVYNYANGGIIDLGAYEYQVLPISPDANNILYVNIAVSGGTGTGNSWANAVKELADALKYAKQQNNYTSANPLKIYVAKGTYKPMYSPEDGANLLTDQGIDNTFLMVNNVQIYGGFDPANNIDDLSDTRIFGSGGSVLSGDIGTSNDNTDNTYHVVISSGAVGVALLNGFTVTGSYSTSSNTGTITVNNQSISRYYGGGMYNRASSPSISNCHFTGNTARDAGGMFNSASSPIISNCSFIGNTASGNGGAMYNSGSSPKISNSRFTENTATYNGGAMSNASSSPTLTNCTFTANTATNNGGAMYNNGTSSLTVTNCLFAGNIIGGGIYNDSGNGKFINVTMVNNDFYISNGTIVLQNSIIWDTISGISYTATYSLLKGLNPTGTGNINATSLAATDIFTDYANGDYTLKNGGAAVNAGSNALFTGLNANTKDLAGNPRVYNYTNSGIIDLGAYEYQGNHVVLPVTLISFTAKADGNYAKLTWQTTNEVNNKGFEIWRKAESEKTTDQSEKSTTFAKIGEIKATQISNFMNQIYTYIDKQRLNGTNYYKLVQIDNNGKETDLGIRTVNFQLSNSGIQFYPNPVKNQLFIVVPKIGETLSIYNVNGEKIFGKQVVKQTEIIDVATWVRGTYTWQIGTQTGKFVKE